MKAFAYLIFFDAHLDVDEDVSETIEQKTTERRARLLCFSRSKDNGNIQHSSLVEGEIHLVLLACRVSIHVNKGRPRMTYVQKCERNLNWALIQCYRHCLVAFIIIVRMIEITSETNQQELIRTERVRR